jgi:hypothetical protein
MYSLVFPGTKEFVYYADYTPEQYEIFDDYLDEIVDCAKLLMSMRGAQKTKVYKVAAVILATKAVLQMDYYQECDIFKSVGVKICPAGTSVKQLSRAEMDLYLMSDCAMLLRQSPSIRVGPLL